LNSDRLYLEHILECISRVEAYTTGGKDQFLSDTLVQDGVLRNLQILAESVLRVSEALQAESPEIPWRQIRGFRNLVVHEYLRIDLEVIWQVVELDLPQLKRGITGLLESSSGNR
jgi:uncharacterized protein with HEPN domain